FPSGLAPVTFTVYAPGLADDGTETTTLSGCVPPAMSKAAGATVAGKSPVVLTSTCPLQPWLANVSIGTLMSLAVPEANVRSWFGCMRNASATLCVQGIATGTDSPNSSP